MIFAGFVCACFPVPHKMALASVLSCLGFAYLPLFVGLMSYGYTKKQALFIFGAIYLIFLFFAMGYMR